MHLGDTEASIISGAGIFYGSISNAMKREAKMAWSPKLQIECRGVDEHLHHAFFFVVSYLNFVAYSPWMACKVGQFVEDELGDIERYATGMSLASACMLGLWTRVSCSDT